MMGTLARRRPERLERRCGARVGGDPPPGAGACVDGVAHDRVAEDEPPRHLGRADELEREQLVERREAVALVALGDRRDQLGLERLARHRGRLQESPRAVGELLELLGERRGHRARNVLLHPCDGGMRRGGAAAARKLLEVEGITAGLPVQAPALALLDVLKQRVRLSRAARSRLRPPSAGRRG